MVDFAAQHPLFNPLERGRRPVESIAPEAMEKLCAHEYRDGNFRELEMYVHGALLTAWRARRRVIELSDLPIGGRPAFRTDARGAKITVRDLPVTDKVVEVVHADELDWLAERFGEAILVESGRADAERVVVHHGTTYRWCKAAGTS
jgi:DNA-binding NtrC family response regulator